MRFPIDVILVSTRWYAAYPLRYRHLEEMMPKRGVSVDHPKSTSGDPLPAPHREGGAQHKLPVGSSWRMDETYIKVKGIYKYRHRAVDRQSKTDDFLLAAKRDMAAAKCFFDKAMAASGTPDKVAMDRRAALTRQRSTSLTPASRFSSLYARSNTSTILLNRTIERVSAWPGPCWALSHSGPPAMC